MSRDYGRRFGVPREVPPFSKWPWPGVRAHTRYKKKVSLWSITGGYCFYCEAPLSFFLFASDHVVAKHRGGSNSPQNRLPACEPCNLNKRISNAIEWSRQRGHLGAARHLKAMGFF